MTSQSNNYRVIGKSTPKVDAIDKVTGRSQFGADIKLPGMLFAKVLRSTHAHAKIRSIDTSKAKALPGVVAVITGDDFPALTVGDAATLGNTSQHDRFMSLEVMAHEKAMFHGHAIAAVAAKSASIAEHALSLIEVEYEPLPFVLDPVEAMKPDAPLLNENLFTTRPDGKDDSPSNVGEHLQYARGDAEAGFAEADVIIERSFRTQSVHQGYIETDAETALVDSNGNVTVWANTQGTYNHRHELAVVLNIPLSKIRVVPTEIGGGFGGKESVRVSSICVALSGKTGLPVRLALTREEVLTATGPGNATVSTIKIGARNDGRITALKANIIYDAGAFPGAPLRSAIRRVFSHYNWPNMLIDAYDVVTNKPHVAAYRAPGATPTNFAAESVIDELGEALGIDPIEFRLKNASRNGDPMPDGVGLSSVNIDALLEKVKSHPCWTTPLYGPNRGRGIAVGMWTMPGGTASCHITLSGDGSVTLATGAVDLSATRTSLAMITAELLGLDMADVRVSIGDTDSAAHSDPSAGDKITYVAGKAVYEACNDLMTKLRQRAAEDLDVAPEYVRYEGKRFWAEGVPELGVSLEALALRSIRGEGALMGSASASATFSTSALAPNAAVHVADVEVDLETGKVEILNYTTFQDVGLSVNPIQVEGQMQGGATQGIGWALSEEYVYDSEGRLENVSLLDYRIPTCVDAPFIGAEPVEYPSADHPLGIRAVGQVPIVPPAAALANAIYRATGVRMRELPMKPERVYWAIEDAKKA